LIRRLINKIFQFTSFRIIGRARTKSFLAALFNVFNFNMLEVAHNEMGINNYGDTNKTGELYFIKNILKEKFNKADGGEIIIFDVGANIGDYSLSLKKIFPLSTIYAFEPNPVSFKKLTEVKEIIAEFHPFCLGLGSGKSQTKIFTYKNHPQSEHATIIKDVMVQLHKSEEVEEYAVDIVSLDSFCEEMNIDRIHFIKIDTEGYELEVLKGAVKLIKNKAIEVIQFEFNEMNIFSKVFMKDFYFMLPDYDFFRLNATNLIPMGKYNTANEIFRFQNIVAFSKDFLTN